MKELMWVCALLPKQEEEEIRSICLEPNKKVRLSEDVFRFPLHISLKKSWECEDFAKIQEDIVACLQQKGEFLVRYESPILRRNMIWLPLDASGRLQEIHEDLDRLLAEKYEIPQDPYDRIYEPHISLFTKGQAEKMSQLYELLKEEIRPGTVKIQRFVVGGSVHRDSFYKF